MIKKQTEKQKPTKKNYKNFAKRKKNINNGKQPPTTSDAFRFPGFGTSQYRSRKKNPFANRRCFERKEQNSPNLRGGFKGD